MQLENAAVINYLESIIHPLLLDPSAMKVDHSVDERGVLLSLSLASCDMGRIIGKAGETVKAIRTILRQYGGAHKMMISLKINEPAGGAPRSYKSTDHYDDIKSQIGWNI